MGVSGYPTASLSAPAAQEPPQLLPSLPFPVTTSLGPGSLGNCKRWCRSCEGCGRWSRNILSLSAAWRNSWAAWRMSYMGPPEPCTGYCILFYPLLTCAICCLVPLGQVMVSWPLSPAWGTQIGSTSWPFLYLGQLPSTLRNYLPHLPRAPLLTPRKQQI